MLKVAVIIGSTRPGRNGEVVAQWVHNVAARRTDAEFELVDLRDFDLPHLDEEMPAATGQYSRAHTQKWAAKIASFDAYVFVTPEYNRSTSGVLKNAIDFLYTEWNNKAAGFVSYGVDGGNRAVEALRLVMGELQVADVRAQVGLSLVTDFENYSTFRPAAQREDILATMLDQVIAWGEALRPLRHTCSSRPPGGRGLAPRTSSGTRG
ncbi:NADPH-dependent FMN reductase [Nonomuraea sp. SBT364]|uniref:NADPH-dependent FMN reductase n=1 Tax=Nonomuraea sp. SBT364 TaxID=1580530 RepID=UPI00066A83FD|nr:NAD(P)H-dependent oxidoreductase [Nonomuraea sp. SBT364]